MGRDRPAELIVDVHHHILPPAYLDALADLGVTRSIGVAFPTWSAEEDLRRMDALGVRAAVASFSTPAANVTDAAAARSLARLCNELMAALIEGHPGRYGGFATLPPLLDTPGAVDELCHALDTLRLDGVELMSNYDLKYLGDPAFQEIYEALNTRRAVVHVHPTNPPGVPFGIPAAVMDAPFDTTRAAFSLICSGVMERYPDITYILSHGGGTLPYISYRLGTMARSVWRSFETNAPRGFNAYLSRFYYDTAIVSLNAFPFLVRQAGASHVVFGTDAPFSGRAVSTECLEAVLTSDEIGEPDRTAVLGGNATTLFLRFGSSGS
ncbi:MAG: amidohydrolase family protein [Thermoleophilia bacterium]